MANIQEAIKRLRYVFTSEGADKVVSDQNKVGAAVVSSTTTQEKASLSLDKAFASLERRYVATVRAQQDYDKVQRTVNAAVAQHPELAGRANVVLSEAAMKYGQAGVAAKAYAAATSGVSSQLIALSAGAGPVGTFLAALGPWGLAAAVGLGAAEKAFSLMSDAAHGLAQKSEELRKFSEVTGLTTDQIQALRSEASKFGVTGDEVQAGIQQFTARFQQLRNGEGDLLTQIRRINPALADQMAATTNAADALTLFGTALKNVDNVFQRNALVKAATGKGGLTSAAFLSGLDVSKLTQSYVAAGKALDENLIRRLAQLDIDIAKTSGKAKQNIASIFSEDVLQAELNFANGFLRISEEMKNFAPSSSWSRVVSDFLKLSQAIPGVGGVITAIRSFSQYGANRPDTFSDRFAPAIQSPLKQMTTDQVGDARALYDYNKLKEQIAAMGDAATAADRLKLALMNLGIAGKDAGLSQGQLAKAAGLLNESFRNQQIQSAVAALGSAATVSEQYAARLSALRLELDKGNISQSTFNRAVAGMEVDRQLQSMRDAISALGDMADETERYRLRLAELQQQLDQGRISQERFNQAAMLAAPGVRDALDTTSSFIKDFKNNLASGQKGWQAFASAGVNALNRISDKLIDMAINNLFLKAFGGSSGFNFLSFLGLGGSFSGGSLGGTGGVLGGLYHDGGIAGAPRQTRRVNAAAFIGAPRMHDGGIAGLGPDEVPAILRRGEPVFKSMADAREKVGLPNMTVQAPTIIVQGDANERTIAEVNAILAKDRQERPKEIAKTMREMRRHGIAA